MSDAKWIQEFPGAITVCDTKGMILEMNEKSCKVFEKDGGEQLIGKSLLDCHPGPARDKVQKLLDEQATNCYTIEKNGIKKFIYQAPWYQDNTFMGLVELVIEIPFDLPHFKR